MQIDYLKINWINFIDIFIVSFLMYYIYKLVKGSVASKVFLGYLLIYLSYLLVKYLGLELLTRILEYFMSVGAIALIVLFQQEIRRFLLILGKSTSLANHQLFKNILNPDAQEDATFPMKIILDTVKTMSGEFTGGIIVIQKEDSLEKYTESGDKLDAILSKKLLLSIFSQYSLLNDGAVIIDYERVIAAHCILPIANNDELPKHYGFRHRAALGITEATDAVAICISEENGKISLALDGEIQTVSVSTLENELKKYFQIN